MNEQTEKLIRELADKLGTTAEHLWSVLIRQAAISGITNIIAILLWAWFAFWSFRLVRRKTTEIKSEGGYFSAQWSDEGAALAWGIWGIGTFVIVAITGANLESIAGSLLNPEYWALKQIIGK
jgi:hypothetical protein